MASSTSGTPASSAPWAASHSTRPSSAWRRRRTAEGTGWWRRTAGSSTSATPASSAVPGGIHLNRPIVGMAVDAERQRLLAGGVRRRDLQLRRRQVPRLHGRQAPELARWSGWPPTRRRAGTGRWAPTVASSPSTPRSTARRAPSTSMLPSSAWRRPRRLGLPVRGDRRRDLHLQRPLLRLHGREVVEQAGRGHGGDLTPPHPAAGPVGPVRPIWLRPCRAHTTQSQRRRRPPVPGRILTPPIRRARHRSGGRVNGIGEEAEQLVARRREGHVLVVSLQRAAKRNAIDRAMADALDAALDELEDDDDLWAGVLTGTTEVFSAGSDLTAGGDYVTERGGEYGIIRRPRRTPLIAAVEGPALGGGLEIVLACDLVVASSTARFGLPEVSIGVVPTCAGLFRATAGTPAQPGPPAHPDRAPDRRPARLRGRPRERAGRAGRGGGRSAGAGPGDLRQRAGVRPGLPARGEQPSSPADDELGWQETSGALAAAAGSADAREGVAAFLEKRPPVWRRSMTAPRRPDRATPARRVRRRRCRRSGHCSRTDGRSCWARSRARTASPRSCPGSPPR